jgi:uncharacterized protein
LEQTVISGDEGDYRFQGLETAFYTLKVESHGLKTRVINHIPLDGLSATTINPTLEVNMEGLMGDVVIMEPSDPLVKAAFDNDLATVKELLSAGAKANTIDENYQMSPLAFAVSRGNLEMIQLLLWHGADVNATNKRGQTALMDLGANSTPEVALALIKAGAKLDLQDDDGNTALIFVAMGTNTEVLRALLDAGASVNLKTRKGLTALMLAAGRGDIDHVKALIAAGADVYERDEAGSTALKHARDNDQRAVMKLLRTYGAIEYSVPQ